MRIEILNNGRLYVTQRANDVLINTWLSDVSLTVLNDRTHFALSSDNGNTIIYLNGVSVGLIENVLFLQAQSISLKENWVKLNQLRITKHPRYNGNFPKVESFVFKNK